ncbi:hypothetical protein T484DRAFT_1961071 [Baffinella frigidus]|nr:hypothetical protein T484DRAFT_1961071 [Cryptophyta sp. CCMP2293]
MVTSEDTDWGTLALVTPAPSGPETDITCGRASSYMVRPAWSSTVALKTRWMTRTLTAPSSTSTGVVTSANHSCTSNTCF